MFCTSCGTQAIEGGQFCTGCGKPALATATVAAPYAGQARVNLGKPGDVSTGAVPDGVKGWSWGAFLLNWIWAIGNRTWIGLLAMVPYIGFFVALWLGFKGREMAWKNREWDSVEHFNRVQKKWSSWAVGITLVSFVVGVLAAIALPAYKHYVERAHEKALESANAEAPAPGLQAAAAEPAPAGAAAAGDDGRSGAIDSNADAAPASLATIAGTLARATGADGNQFVTLNGARLFNGDDAAWQFPLRVFQLSQGRQAILMASSGGRGNSCETLFFFLLADRSGVRATPEFGTCAPQGSFAQHGDQVAMRLPKMGGNSSFVLTDGTVLEDGQPVVMNDSVDPAK